MKKLNCSYNSIVTMNLNSLSVLRELDCAHNSLTSLLTQNINNTIDYFDCSYNNLTSLVMPNFYEFLDMGDQYIIANCSHNQLTSIVFAPNEQLSGLNLSYNNFTSLSLSTTYLEILGGLNLSNNPLTMVNLDNVSVHGQSSDDSGSFICDNTSLTELYVPFGITLGSSISNNPNLVHLNFKNGQTNYDYYWELDQNGEETGNIIYEGPTISNNPNLGLLCCDENEIGFFTGVVASNVQVTEYCNFIPGGNYNVISGTVSYNCPNGTAVSTNARVRLNNQYNASFSSNGQYAFYTSYGNQNVSVDFSEPGYFTVTPPNFSINFPATGSQSTANFCVSPNGVHPDLAVSILPVTIARPGFNARYKLIIKNKGTEIESGSITLNFNDAILDYVTATPTTTNQGNGMLNWDFTDLHPFEDKKIEFTLNVNSPMEIPAVNIGDTLAYTAAVASSQTDETPNDNSQTLDQIVVGSLDPNDKTVLEGPQVDISQVGEYLNYVVRFQNTGTAAAENVVVKDLLEYSLDLTSLRIVSASHPYRVAYSAPKLEVIFENINLPVASIDEPGSQGYVAFQIKPRTTTVVGDVVENTALIYFDYNFPIVTNTVSTTFTALGVADNQRNLFQVFPNPTSGILNISNSDNQPITKATVNTILGQTVIVIKNTDALDVSTLAKGTYFITVETNSGKQTQQFIKF